MKTMVKCFFLAAFLAVAAFAADAAQMGVVKGSYINVREDPSFGGKVVSKKLRGESYTILFEEKGWRKVTFSDGISGWIFPSLIEKRGAAPTEEPEDKPAATSAAAVPALPSGIATGTPAAAKPPKEKPPKEKPAKEKPGKSEDSAAKPEVKPAPVPAAPAEITAPPSEEGEPGEKRTSKSAEDFYNEAIDLYEKKRYANALDANREALKQAPRNAQILNNMANCFFKLGKLEDAVTNWRKALEITPKSAKICNNLGIAYYQMDENDKAIEFYKKAILFEPQFPDPYYNIASVFGFKGMFQDSLEYYRKYMEFAPDATMKQLTEERIEYCKKQLEGNKKGAAASAPAPEKKQ